MGRVAEFYDPLGVFEPVKLNLKLMLSELNHLPWDSPVPLDQQDKWVNLLTLIDAMPEVEIPRCVRPPRAEKHVRLLCFADAGEQAGGCAIYAGYRFPEGDFSCQLIYAKSRLMHSTVPRNELEAILMCAEASLLVQKALGDTVKEVVYFSDSTIALSWILNGRKRLRMWVHNRVAEILTAIKWVIGGKDTYPIFHVASEDNVADMVTKPRQVYMSDVSRYSAWQTYSDWMRLPTESLPKRQVTTPEEMAEKGEFEKELFPDIGPVDEAVSYTHLRAHET